MMVDDLYNMTVRELLDTFCVVYSPECGYYYGITRWDDAMEIHEEYDLENEYCFMGDYLIPLEYGFDHGEDILELKDLKCVMEKLGIPKKQSCPICGSDDYHLDYNEMMMVCGECEHKGDVK